MGEMGDEVFVVASLNLDLALVKEGRSLLTSCAQEGSSPVFPALAVILACTALELAIEGHLKLSEIRARKGGKGAGFMFDVSLEAIEAAYKSSLRWKLEHIPALTTEGAYSTSALVPELIPDLKRLVEQRNQLVHGRGRPICEDSPIEAVDQVDDAGPGYKVTFSAPRPWGALWIQVTPDEARKYLNAVERYIQVCIVPADSNAPPPS